MGAIEEAAEATKRAAWGALGGDEPDPTLSIPLPYPSRGEGCRSRLTPAGLASLRSHVGDAVATADRSQVEELRRLQALAERVTERPGWGLTYQFQL